MTSLIPSPNVSLVNGQPATTSFAIAEHFRKQHAHVLRDIRRLMADLPEDVRESNFGLTLRTVAGPNNSQRQEEYFIVFFDGFILLAMGYTGKQALQIKLVYIAAFNAMRDELAGRVQPHAAPALDTSSRLSTRKDSERKELTAAINAWVGCAPIHYAGARNIINAHFGVKSVDEMTVAQVREAVALVHQRIAETPKQAALPPARSEKDAARDNWLTAHRDFYSFQNAVSQPRTAFDGETRALKRHYGYATTENTALEVIEYLLALRVYLDGAITSATSVAKRLTE